MIWTQEGAVFKVNYVKKSKKRHERARKSENAEKYTIHGLLLFFNNFFAKIFFGKKYLFGLYNAYFFELEGVRQWFEHRKTRDFGSIIWKNRKRGTKGPEIVKMVRNLSFCDLFTIFGEKYFSQKYFCVKYLFGPYNPYFFDLERVKQWFERRKTNDSRSIIWENQKRGTKGLEIVKAVANLDFCGFLQKFGGKIFSPIF